MAQINITNGSDKQIAWATEIANGQVAILLAQAKQMREMDHPSAQKAADNLDAAVVKMVGVFNSLPASKIIDIRNHNVAEGMAKQAKEAAGVKLSAI